MESELQQRANAMSSPAQRNEIGKLQADLFVQDKQRDEEGHMSTYEDDRLRRYTFACLCGRVSGDFSLPESSRIPFGLCHCHECRHCSGVLTDATLILPAPYMSTVKVSGPTIGYTSSEVLTRHFCPTCGSHVYFETFVPEHTVDPCSGSVDQPDRLQLTHQIFLRATSDGGISVWLTDVPIWSNRNKSSLQLDHSMFYPSIFATSRSNSLATAQATTPVKCVCACGSVSFRVAAPPLPREVRTAFPPGFSAGEYSDLIVPRSSLHGSDETDAHGRRISNPGNEFWFLRKVRNKDGTEGTRFLAGLCTCHSCRKSCGSVFQPWAFVPRHMILSPSQQSGNKAGKDEVLDIEALVKSSDNEMLAGNKDDSSRGRLKTYESSPGVYRDFCSQCGATIFWRSDRRPDVVDVSVGLMEAEAYVRAERWLDWCTDRVSFEEEAAGEPILKSIKAGMKAWSEMQRGIR